MRRSDIEGWKFDWLHVSLGHDIYELFLKNDPIVQGRVAVCMDKGFARVDIVETAPHNFGHTGRYEGVGGHLFAIACKISWDNGGDGVVSFTAKSKLISYYEQKLNARRVGGTQQMFIDEAAAQILLDKYIRK